MTEAEEKQISTIEQSIKQARQWAPDAPSLVLDGHAFLCKKVRSLDAVYCAAAALVDSMTHPEAQQALVALTQAVGSYRRGIS